MALKNFHLAKFLVFVLFGIFGISKSNGLAIQKNSTSTAFFQLANSISSELRGNNLDLGAAEVYSETEPEDILFVTLETLKAFHESFPSASLSSISSTKPHRRVKRIKREESTPPEADKDKTTTVKPSGDSGGSGAGSGAYPNVTTPNATCITMDDLHLRRGMMNSSYGKTARKRCPKKFPCKDFGSCSIWRTGFVDKTLKLDTATATSYYTDLFAWMHKTKLDAIIKNFGDCVTEYKLGEAFEDPFSKKKEGADAAKDDSKKPKTKRQADGEQPKTGADTGGAATKSDSASSDSDAQDPAIMCLEKIEDYLECFDRAAIQGTCYWPDTSSTEKRI